VCPGANGIAPEPNTTRLSLSSFLLGPLGLRRIVDHLEHLAGGDVEGDANTDQADLGILLADWGEGCP